MRFVDPDGMRVDEWELNNETGELKNVKDTDKDIVFIVDNKTGQRTGEQLEYSEDNVINKSVRNTQDAQGKPISITNLSFKNKKDGADFYDFAVKNTGDNIEWSYLDLTPLVNPNQELFSVFNSGREGEEAGGASMAELLSSENPISYRINEVGHSHTRSDAEICTSENDRDNRDKVLSKNPNCRFFLTFKSNKKFQSREYTHDDNTFHCGEFK